MPHGHTGNRSDASDIRDLRAIRSATYLERPVTGAVSEVITSDSVKPQATATSLRDVKKLQAPNRPTRSLAARPALPRQNPSIVLHRSGFGPKMARKNLPKLRKPVRDRKFYVLRGMVVLIFLCGIGVVVNARHINNIAKTQAAVLAKTSGEGDRGGAVLSEQSLDANAIASYSVPPNLPRLLTIPKIQVNARILRLGTTADNDLRSPGNIFEVGWYEGSSKPGESGTIVLNGHISGPSKHGVFYSLANLHENDKITLERGDGTMFHYKVVKQEIYDHDKLDMPALLTSAEPGKPGLNMVTSGGRFDVRTNKFERRTVIFAVQE